MDRVNPEASPRSHRHDRAFLDGELGEQESLNLIRKARTARNSIRTRHRWLRFAPGRRKFAMVEWCQKAIHSGILISRSPIVYL